MNAKMMLQLRELSMAIDGRDWVSYSFLPFSPSFLSTLTYLNTCRIPS